MCAAKGPHSTNDAFSELTIDEIGSMTISSFVAWHTSMLCVASYAADPIERLYNQDMSASRFTSCFVSDYGSYTGKFIVCDATDEAGQEYLFVCFRGTKTGDGVVVDLSVWQTADQVNSIHAGFLERAEVFPLVPIFTALQEGKRVVLTGHSLGGACAMVLATKFFNTYGQFDYDDGQVQCVTYGSPLIGDCSVCGYLYKRAQHFHNYILEGDLVPLSLTILADVTPALIKQIPATASVKTPASSAKEHVLSYSPFGQFYHLKTTNELLPSDLAPMSPEQIRKYFSTNYYESWFGRKNVSDHAMDNYRNALFPKPSTSPSALGSPPVPTISACSVKDNVLIVTGANLSYCFDVTLLGTQLRVCRSYEASDACAVFPMSDMEDFKKELAVAIAEKKLVDVYVSTVLGTRSENASVCVTVKRAEDFLSPGQVLGGMCPLATLLVRADAELSPETRGYFDEILQHCEALSDSVPIEFAFRCLQKDTADTDHKFLQMLLPRLAGFQIEWKDARSQVMVNILQDVVNALASSKVTSETSKSRLELIRTALKPDALKDFLREMKTANTSGGNPIVCGQSISMLVRPVGVPDAALEPFVSLFPPLVAASELEVKDEHEKRYLINRAYEAIAKAGFLSDLLEDSITFGIRSYSTESKTNGPEIATVLTLAAFVVLTANPVTAVGYGLYVAGAELAATGIAQLAVARVAAQQVAALYQSQKQLSSYKDIVDEISFRMGQKKRTASLLDKEEFVTFGLPSDIGKLGLAELVRRKDTLFTHPRFKNILTGGIWDELTISLLKMIYHCMHLRRLRRQITLVTVAGEKNAGKTSLNFEVFGEDVVQARMGTGLEETTIYPSAYFLPEHPSVIFCDLPGCSDADTAEMCDLFLKLGDVSVFVLKQNTAANPRAGDPLYDTISVILQCKGPRLICINHADNLLRVGKSKKERDEYNPEAKLKKECEVWAASNLFGTIISSCSDNTTAPKWKCEEAHPNAVVASIRTAEGALSVWMTAFDPQVEREKAAELLFGAAHVREWVEEVQEMVTSGNSSTA